jgi:glycyl-tRNA synthetase alpha chain
MWNDQLSYRDVNYDLEMQDNVYNFEVASTEMLFRLFDMFEAESKRVIETPVYWDAEQEILSAGAEQAVKEMELAGVSGAASGQSKAPGAERPLHTPLALVYPALDLALKCSHTFNVLDARGAVGVTERSAYINRIRARVRACCLKHVEQFKERK